MSEIVEANLKAPYQPSWDMSPKEELDYRVESVLELAKMLEGDDNRISSIIIDADKALKIIRRKRWWQVWKTNPPRSEESSE